MVSVKTRLVSLLLALVMIFAMVPAQVFATEEAAEIESQADNAEYSISDYETFIFYLMVLEEAAQAYVMEMDQEADPLDLIIKYIRTGVDRYNSGSWGIMAGYENPQFVEFVQMLEDMVNSEATCEEEKIHINSLKNLHNFVLPNGETADMGHIFGTMDITYHNSFGTNHADVAGWAGDLVDLMSYADYGNVSGSVSEMVEKIAADHFLQTPPSDIPGMNQLDFRGDLDALYIMQKLQKDGYTFELDVSGLALTLMEYFTEDLDDVARADYFLRNRLGGASTMVDIRDAVYSAYMNNKVISTLEGTREFNTTQLDDLRKATCYVFADYVCKLAGDYVENNNNTQYTVFSTETQTLAPGVVQTTKMATNNEGEQMVYYLATADITRDDVHVYANYNNNDPAAGWAMQRVMDQANAAQAKYGDPESEHYIENYNVVASVNGAGFNMQTGEPAGLLIMGGVEYKGVDSRGFFGILKDGTPVIATTEEYNTIYKGQVQEAIAGFSSILIKDGKVTPGLSNDRASRTAVGITKTGKVVFLVIDGRQLPYSSGGGFADIAQILLDAGCVTAVNLDGGGSSTFVARMPGEEELSVINNPSDGFQRSVSTSWMVVSTAPSSTAFDHANLETASDYLTLGSSVQITPVGISATGNAAQLPEGTTWALSDDRFGTITEDGVFTSQRIGAVTVNLMLGDQVIGSKVLNVVTPNNLKFTRDSLDMVYGESVQLPIKLYYDGKQVIANANDVTFSMSNSVAGTMDGFSFVSTANENTSIKGVAITAALVANPGITDEIAVSLYKQGELTFDFDQATGGNRMLAWYREVTNTTTEDSKVYTVVDADQQMVTNYTLAIDMTQIPIPQRLEDLTYMLPGADLAGASAWTFLLQLAERISPLTEITAQIQIDPNMDADISNIQLINEYFDLTSATVDENNVLTLKLQWIDQTAAIDPDKANSLCLVNGLKLTPKADAQWEDDGSMDVIHVGDVSYKVYMRASALYSFSQKEENQQKFGLYPYVHPEDSKDAGGYFQDTYATFEDSYTLINELKEGWYMEDAGYAYYVAGEKLTGVQQIDGLYYNFGTEGYNVGKTVYTGILTIGSKTYYSLLGVLTSGWQAINGNYYYFNPNSFAAHTGFSSIGGRTYTFNEKGVLERGAFVKTSKGVCYYWAGKLMAREWIELEEGIYYANDDGYVVYGNYPVREDATKPTTWWHFDETTGLRTGICDGFVQMNGATYYCENGKWTYGAVKIAGGIIFCGNNGLVTINNTCYVSSNLDSTADLETGHYWCGADGYILGNGFATIKGNTYYFVDYVRAKGFTKVGEDYYFFNTGNGTMQKNKVVWVGGNNAYGIPSGYYTFQADGTMYVPDPNGEKLVVEKNGDLYFTIDGVNQTNGLNELNGEYYYAQRSGKLVTNSIIWISSFNDLMAPGNGYFAFDAEGKLIKNGFVSGGGYTYYYDNLVRAKGFRKIGESYYFFNTGSGKMIKDSIVWIGGNNAYGIPAGYYTFQADGTMYIPDPNGEKLVVEKNGALYFTIDGVNQTNGLNELDGEYYYANSNGKLAVNTVVWISSFNDLMAPGKGYFAFGADGKLIKTGFVTGGGYTYYYDDLDRAKGFCKIGESYYFFNTGSGKMVKDSIVWIGGNNAYGFAAGYYTFQADGTMYVPDPNGEKLVVEKNGALYFTIDGVNQTNGLNELDGEYYYANSNGKLAVNTVVWISNFNDLMAPGKGYFAFGADGKLIKTGFATGGGYTYYYDDLVRAKGLVKIGEDYYFFNTGSGKMAVDTNVWVGGNNAYGLKSGSYYFDSNGKMVQK